MLPVNAGEPRELLDPAIDKKRGGSDPSVCYTEEHSPRSNETAAG